MRKLFIATGASRTAVLWKNTAITWDELKERLRTTCRTTETQGEYANMTKAQQDAIKDVGGFVGGKLRSGRRKADHVDCRDILTLDADFAAEDFCDQLDIFLSCAWCVYSTHKHTPEKPRLRLLIPLDRSVSAEEYEAISRKVAEEIGFDQFDDTTYQAHRLRVANFGQDTEKEGKPAEKAGRSHNEKRDRRGFLPYIYRGGGNGTLSSGRIYCLCCGGEIHLRRRQHCSRGNRI